MARKLLGLILGVGLLASAIPVVAHHSVSAEFDTTKTISFTGKVKITDQQPPTSFRLTVEGTGKIGTVDPLSIIHDSNEGQSTSFHIDRDMQAPCIETIFQ